MDIKIGKHPGYGYFLRIHTSDESNLSSDEDIINYFNLPQKYWFDKLLSYTSAEMHSMGVYFIKKEDCEDVQQWVEDNLDYFLILRKLGGE